MEKVTMDYEFVVVAGRGNSSARSLAQRAHQMAHVFYGDLPYTVHVEVKGKTNDYYVNCVASANIEVETDDGR